MHAMLPLLDQLAFPPIRRGVLEALQVNLTYRCNQRCLHCHVNAGPTRTEAMSDECLAVLHRVIDAHPVHTLDLTGGAPELHPRFREIVRHARREGLRVIDRCKRCAVKSPTAMATSAPRHPIMNTPRKRAARSPGLLISTTLP